MISSAPSPLQIVDGPSVLRSNGGAYVISNFEYDGQVPVDAFVATDDYSTGNFGQQRLAQPQPRINELSLSLAIVNFPD